MGTGPQKVILPQQAAGRSSKDALQGSSIKTVAVAREVANRRQTRDRVFARVDSDAVGGFDEAVPARVDWVFARVDSVFARMDWVFAQMDWVFAQMDWVFARMD
jgi:hypothetical protein